MAALRYDHSIESKAGYVKSRYIGENVRLIQDIIEHTNLTDKKGIALFLDLKKKRLIQTGKLFDNRGGRQNFKILFSTHLRLSQ